MNDMHRQPFIVQPLLENLIQDFDHSSTFEKTYQQINTSKYDVLPILWNSRYPGKLGIILN